MRRDLSFIDGVWCESASRRFAPVEDPATQEIFADVPDGDASDADRAVAAARRAFAEGPWPRMTPEDRRVHLLRLFERLSASQREGVAWRLIGQQVLFGQVRTAEGLIRNPDAWDGYPAARQRLFEQLRSTPNPVVLAGDVHSFNASQLKLDFDQAASPVVASEFVTTSITSQAWAQERLNRYLPDNPHVLLADSRFRGYARAELRRGRLQVDLRAMESAQQLEAPCSTLATFVVEDGRPGPVRAAG